MCNLKQATNIQTSHRSSEVILGPLMFDFTDKMPPGDSSSAEALRDKRRAMNCQLGAIGSSQFHTVPLGMTVSPVRFGHLQVGT